MEYKNVLNIISRQEFRVWLEIHSSSESECYVSVKRGRPVDDKHFWYVDAVEEALCFGWIDSTIRKIDGVSMQRFSPRKLGSNWTELNKERVRRLEKLGLMTKAGRAVMSFDINAQFKIDPVIQEVLQDASVYEQVTKFHPLYQRIRLSNLSFYRQHYPSSYKRMLDHFLEETKNGKMYGDWNDYGRLLDY